MKAITNTTYDELINYKIPNDYIDCKFLRIHITDVYFPSDLASKTTGFILNEIFGEMRTNGSSLAGISFFSYFIFA